MKVVYVSGPYRGSSHWEVARNIERAREAARRLWSLGVVVICPHANTAMMDGDGIDFLAGDLELVRRSDAVVMLEGWEASEGARREREEAIRCGIPVYLGVEEAERALAGGADHASRVRRFDTGATRDADDGKLDIEGFFSPVVLLRFAEYMHRHRRTALGVRASDDWQKGMPKQVYMKSALRHVLEWWLAHRGCAASVYGGRKSLDADRLREAICGVLFNAMGYLYELEREGCDSAQPSSLSEAS